MAEVGEESLAEDLRERFRRELEQKEAAARAKAEAHLYTTVRLMTEQDIRRQVGVSTHFDLADWRHVREERVRREEPMEALRGRLAGELGLQPQQLRLWRCQLRKNGTVRPCEALGEEELQMPLRELLRGGYSAEAVPLYSREQDLRIFVETPREGESALPPPGRHLVFVKHYDAVQGRLSYLGSVHLHPNQRMSELLPAVGLPQLGEGQFRLVEEVKSQPEVMCDQVDPRATPKSIKLEPAGDIIVVQQLSPAAEASAHPTVPSFLSWVKNRRSVTVRQQSDPREAGLQIEMMADDSVEQACARVCSGLRASGLAVPGPEYLQLWPSNLQGRPAVAPIRSTDTRQLEDLLPLSLAGAAQPQQQGLLFYRVLDLPLSQYERLREVRAAWFNRRAEFVGEFKVMVPEDAGAGAVFEEIRRRVLAEPSTAQQALATPGAPLRGLLMQKNRIHKLVAADAALSDLGQPDWWEIRVEEVPQDEQRLEADARLVQVVHVSPNPGRQHSLAPFLLKVSGKEPVRDLRKRLQAKLGVPADEFASWNLGEAEGREVLAGGARPILSNARCRNLCSPEQQV